MGATRGYSYRSCFQTLFDVVVCGAGYAGFAAAGRLARAGKRVLMIDLRGDVLWESGRSFCQQAGNGDPGGGFAELLDSFSRVGGARDGSVDGAVAEIIANESLLKDNPNALYHCRPVAVETDGSMLAAVLVATRRGVQRIAAAQWVDATDEGLLVRLTEPARAFAAPSRRLAFVYLQQMTWPRTDSVEIPVADLARCRVTWGPTLWPNQRCLSIELAGAETGFRGAFVPALKALRDRYGRDIKDAIVTHASVRALPLYEGTGSAPAEPTPNVALAVASLAEGPVRSPAHRFDLGDRAALRLLERPACRAGAALLGRPATLPQAAPTLSADVAVIGAGTGGAVAAIAAGREGARTVAVDPQPYAGGIGTGGGINSYYWGVSGGVQDEIDERVAAIMPLFAARELWGGFHFEAKKIVLDEMLREAGVRLMDDAALFAVERREGRVTRGLLATEVGPLALAATAWIDGTGDGDLCAFAGAAHRYGRSGDGNLHAYTQSSGYIRQKGEKIVKGGVNYDSGYVDVTDSEDMTRARLEGVHQYFKVTYDAFHRPTYIAPLIGLRQGRQIETDYVLTLDDLYDRRKFEDSVGYTGSRYDNHAVDYEWESKDAMFLAWGCFIRRASTACEIPYRMLLPRGLDNVWIASRALGVTEEAHSSMRMQRDMQRVGEVCGIAAAMAARSGAESRGVPYAELRARLEAAGAMTLKDEAKDRFGREIVAVHWATPYGGREKGALLRQCLEELSRPSPGFALWHLYRAGRQALGEALPGLLASSDADVVWRANLLLAAWGDQAAEPRLLEAVRGREEGAEYWQALKDWDLPEDEYRRRQESDAASRSTVLPGRDHPVPRWWTAAAFLRYCGTPMCFQPLAQLASTPGVQLNVCSIIALTCAHVAARCALSQAERALMLGLLDTIASLQPGGAVAPLLRDPVTGEVDIRMRDFWSEVGPLAEENFTWQVHYAIGLARAAVGEALHAEGRRFLEDRRSLVRSAFSTLVDPGRKSSAAAGA